MSGIYIHIPFCKQACHYCDFHFSTSLKKKDEIIQTLVKELQLRKDEFKNQMVETIYFGGGTPSLLTIEELRLLIDEVYKNYNVIQNPEITLEANPDDLVSPRAQSRGLTYNDIFQNYKNIGINRLSIGIQSFFEDDLKLMNRAHNADEAKKCLEIATQYFDNITIDLIYGIPNMSNEKWIENIETVLSFGIPHISSYALTVEPKTALKKLIERGEISKPKEEVAENHFFILVEKLKEKGFVHYELSNFGKPNYFSKHNTSYWQGKPYLGIGPSAHSFNGNQRSWNVANNALYIKSLQDGKLPKESEKLSITDSYNEYIMTGLRTIWGVSLERIENEFGKHYKTYLLKQSERYFAEDLLYLDNDTLLVTSKGKFLSDGIASHLFMLNLE